MSEGNQRSKKALLLGKRLARSIWLFPVALTVLLLGLTAFGISGSSVGVYHDYFYGESTEDKSLLFSEPRPIRSDEWLVNTQLALAQSNNGFERINDNIGHGQDVSLLSDAPYTEWSTVFKPHNVGFFVLPFDQAFAFRWWVMGYLLMLSCYFFALCLLPGKRLIASLIAIAVFFAPFIQWLYLYGTMGALFYALFGGVVFIKLMNAASRRAQILWSLLLAYILTCFALILYPPFQIPVLIVLFTFLIGYLIEKGPSLGKKALRQRLGYVFGAALIAGALCLAFLGTRPEAVEGVQNTAYPGKRSIVASGDFDRAHYFSSHLAAQFLSLDTAAHYRVKNLAPSHQSEASNFMLVLPFLILPAMTLLAYGYKKHRQIDWPLALTTALFLVFLAWLFVPSLSRIPNLLTLGQVPTYRLLIGTGLLGIIHLILVIRNLAKLPKTIFRLVPTAIYGALIYAFLVALGYYALRRSPGFITIDEIWILAMPIPAVVFLLLRRWFVTALSILVLFSIYSSAAINPLYRGNAALSDNNLSRSIQALSKEPGRWVVTDDLALENIASLNGAKSLSGVYAYPQPKLWENIDPANDEYVYNRYAHVIFTLDRNPAVNLPTKLTLMQEDYFQVNTEPCSDFLKQQDVRYLLTTVALDPADKCATLIEQINYPPRTFLIYSLDWSNQR